MIGPLCALLPWLAAVAVTRRREEHQPIQSALWVGFGYAASARIDGLTDVHYPRGLLVLWCLLALWSGTAYVHAFGDRRPALPITLAMTIATLVVPALWTGDAHWWRLATWGSFAVSSAMGLWGLWRWSRGEGRFGSRVIRVPMGITQRVALALLASDVCMLLFIAAPQVQVWQGRLAGLIVTGMQLHWLWIERRNRG